jgi:protein-S-isoprenylcysteine O-methyltransferase Ste14
LPLVFVAASQAGGFEQLAGEILDESREVGCLFIAFLGLAVRALTVGFTPRGTSGRDTKRQRASTLNTKGLYSVVRNPLYLGNYIVLVGLALIPAVWWLPLIASLGFILYYERIVYAEEAFLMGQFGSAYTDWASRVPAFLPNPLLWVRPDLPFSIRTVLRREYNGFYVIVSGFTLIELAGDLLGEKEGLRGWWEGDFHWFVMFVAGTVLYLVLRTLNRHTKLLRVPGR